MQPFADIRAVLFDLDGTLVHTRIDFPGMRRAILDLVASAGLDPDEYRNRDALAAIAAAAAMLDDPTGFLAAAKARLLAIELAACEGAEEAAGAAETLLWLRERGIGVGIITRNCRPAVERVLTQIPLPHDVLLTREDTPRVKPDPLHLHLALERLAVAPAYSLMVGDHRMDVQGGKAAGTRTLGLLTDGRTPDFFRDAAPDGVIRAIPELRQWIFPSSS